MLAELPDVWADALDRLLGAGPAARPGFGNLLWQAVVGAWPASRERLHAYAEKAMREAGDHTTWTEPDDDLRAGRARGRRRGVRRRRGARPCSATSWHASPGPGWSNALSAKLRRADMPGVPGRLPGQRARGSRAWSTPTTGGRSTSTRVARCWPGCSAASVRCSHRRSTTPATPSCSSPSPRYPASRPAAPVHDVRARDGRGRAAAHVLAFDRGGAVTRRHPAARGAGRARLGRHRATPPRRSVGRPPHRP